MMQMEDLNKTLDFWIGELDQYDFETLCVKPSENSWSLGQVYMHLIENGRFYIEEISQCLAGNQYVDNEPSDIAKQMFTKNELPDEMIEGPEENKQTPQPPDKQYLEESMLGFKREINALAERVSTTAFAGKTKHPGLLYFGAKDWLQFADMHFRHHMRQKKRIDAYLRSRKLINRQT